VTLFPHDGIAPEDGDCVQINIKQVQMEQDTAKSLVQPGSSTLLDFNRVSHPLIEIITLPEIHHPATAAACVRKIQAILKSVGAVTAGMEMGGLRADVNVSVRRTGRDETGNDEYKEYGITGLGQRTEIKNLSSFKAVEDAIIAERDRQIQVLEAGGEIVGETRGWTLGSTETRKLRGKEGEVDYRYMPDPDLGPLLISSVSGTLDGASSIADRKQELIETLQSTLPMTPDATLSLLQESPHQRLSAKDAMTLLNLDDGDRVDYYMDVLDQLRKMAGSKKYLTNQKPGLVGNW
jgi:aspartyl-tRNA(Asn)/glutamyl-tRNA(Gln) amidotransferase subunit B